MMLKAGIFVERALEREELELRCSYDLEPVPARRRARREEYCSERCRIEARNWRRRARRAARGAS